MSDMKQRPKVVYWNANPAPYMIDRFNAISRRGNVELETWFCDRTRPHRSWAIQEEKWCFPYRYLPAFTIVGKRIRIPTPMLTTDADVIVSLYAEPSYVVGWSIATIKRKARGFWVEVTFDNWVKRRRWKSSLRRFLFRRIDGILTVGPDGRAFAETSGARPECIFEARHSIDVVSISNRSKDARRTRDDFRDHLGLRGCTFIYVGRLWEGKGIRYLLDAFEIVQRAVPESSLLIMGDGAQESELRDIVTTKNLQSVVFGGFEQSDVLPDYYAASDVFVFPTLGDPYGLVVDEAMACELPVIVTENTGEFGLRVEEGKNGFVVPPKDACSLASRMIELARDPEMRKRMGRASRDAIAENTPERFAQQFEIAVLNMLVAAGISETDPRRMSLATALAKEKEQDKNS